MSLGKRERERELVLEFTQFYSGIFFNPPNFHDIGLSEIYYPVRKGLGR